MNTVHVLYDGTRYTRNSEALIFPLKYNERRLQNHGVALRFFTSVTPELFECDTLCLGSAFFKTSWEESRRVEIFSFLADARRRVHRIVWFDTGDSTGSTKFLVLPYVDCYAKNQVLKDRRAYKKKYFGGRIFTDFFHTQFGVPDESVDAPHLNVIPADEHIQKIIVGWNYGMAHYGYSGELFGKIWYQYSNIPRFYPLRWFSPEHERSIQFSCRIGTTYARATIGYIRKEINRLLTGRIAVNKISRKKYFRELRNSVSAISPFGFGEICYRDFEIMICGAAMIKQNMDHLETWPQLWINNETYLPLAWDFSDFQEKIEYAATHQDAMIALARSAQKRYQQLLCTEEGHQSFCKHFINIVLPS